MKIAIRRGHQKTGQDGCASGIVNEIVVAEDYKNRLVAKLKNLGHSVLDVTPPEANRTLSNSLNYGIDMANRWGAELFISCHVNNAYDKYNGALGCEVLYYKNSSKGKDYAIKVERELATLGFKSRGPKADVRGLAEINGTVCPCIIIEPFFVESKTDVAKYHSVGGEGIANAIVKGVTGKTLSVPKKEVKKMETRPKYDETRPSEGNGIIHFGTHSYVEETKDGRTIFHMDRGNYITIGKGLIDIYWNDNKGHGGHKRLSD